MMGGRREGRGETERDPLTDPVFKPKIIIIILLINGGGEHTIPEKL